MRTSIPSIVLAAGFIAAGAALTVSPAAATGSCANPGTPSSNKALVKEFYVALDTKNKELLDDVLSAGWIDVPMAPGQKAGRAGMKGAMDGYFQAFLTSTWSIRT